MYQVGDYVVKPANGVCKVGNIVHLDLSAEDKNRLYYLLIPVNDKHAKVYLPTDTTFSNIRKTMTKEEALKFIDRIPEMKEPWIEDDKLREKKYKEVIKSGDPQALVGMIKMIYLRRQARLEKGKKSIAMDERYFALAENNLYSELGFALNIDTKDVCSLITEEMKKKETM